MSNRSELVVSPSKPKRIRLVSLLLPVTFFALCAVAYLWYFWLPFEGRLLYRNTPVTRLVPAELRDNTISPATGGTLRYLGYEFQIPWDDPDTSDAKVGGNVAIIPFRSGLTVAFLTHPPHEFIDNLTKSGLVKRQRLCEIYGNAACESDFVLKKMIFNASPDKLGFFATRQEAGKQSVLLLLKAAAVEEPSGLFLVATKEFQGFQFGNPQTARGSIVDELYGNDAMLEFIFARPDGRPLGISQPQINRVLQTVHRKQRE
jgi:hypothetical protein